MGAGRENAARRDGEIMSDYPVPDFDDDDEFDIDDDFDEFDPDSYLNSDECDGPRCPYCGSTCTTIVGAVSHGDGDLQDEADCDACGETFDIESTRVWYANDGTKCATEEEMWVLDAMLAEEAEADAANADVVNASHLPLDKSKGLP